MKGETVSQGEGESSGRSRKPGKKEPEEPKRSLEQPKADVSERESDRVHACTGGQKNGIPPSRHQAWKNGNPPLMHQVWESTPQTPGMWLCGL